METLARCLVAVALREWLYLLWVVQICWYIFQYEVVLLHAASNFWRRLARCALPVEFPGYVTSCSPRDILISWYASSRVVGPRNLLLWGLAQEVPRSQDSRQDVDISTDKHAIRRAAEGHSGSL